MKTATQIADENKVTRQYVWQIAKQLQLKPALVGARLYVFTEADEKQITDRLKPKKK